MTIRKLCLVLALMTRLGGALVAVESEWKQQFSAWFSLNDDKPSTPRFGLRYQPTLSLGKTLGKGWKLDSELSLDLSAAGAAPSWKSPDLDGAIKPYRLWLRLSSTRFEARLGLQRINFGSATLIRPLMWFDSLDPRDPLQVTAGVYGLLLRYYFKNNANAWLWGLYGNDEYKGRETLPTARRTPEFGGRFQAPLFSGEGGVTFHFRRVDPASASALRPAESRVALDGKWDIGVGLWAESAFVHRDDLTTRRDWQRSLTVGIDYTFKLGNGLYLLAEQFFSAYSPSALGSGGEATVISTLLVRYPFGLLDSLSAIPYYDWHDRRLYVFANWQRTYDRWQFNLMLFWNPRLMQTDGSPLGSPMFSGRGFQLMAIWNI
jgi:hypothetical protein